MTATRFIIEPLDKQDRSRFHCGVEPLDRYFRQQVGQDIRRSLTACFIAQERDTGEIAGYYTLAAADVPVTDLPPELTRRLPRYPSVPAARIGRLAVDERFRGCKLGSVMLASAAHRAAAGDLAVFALIVDAKDEKAAAFYRHHGFADYGSAPGHLVAPLQPLLTR